MGETKHSVLEFIYKGKTNPHRISKLLKIARSTTIQHLEELRKKGLVTKGIDNENKYGDRWFITEKGKVLIEKCVGINQFSSHKDKLRHKKVRGHGFIWKLKPNKSFDWKNILKEKQIKYELKGISKTPRVIINNKKIWLGKNFITLFETKSNSFFNKTPSKSRNDAIYEMNKDIEYLKEMLGIAFNYKFTCRRQHYGFVDNKEARFFIKKGKKILIKNEKGYWFTIDFSSNEYKEAETIHERDAEKDGTNYQNYMNSHERTGFKVTPEFILEGLNILKENQENQSEGISKFAIALNKHIPAYEGMAKEVKLLRETIEELKKYIKK